MIRSVYFISGCKAGTTFEYRVLQKQEQLAACGIQSTVKPDLIDRETLFQEAAAHDILYLYRVAYDPLIEGLIEQARGQGVPIIFDTDDLVFEPDLVHYVDPVKAMNDEDAALYYEGVWRYRHTLLASDAVVTSTEYLADKVRALGKPVFVHRNGLSQWMIKAAAELPPRSIPAAHDRIILGYGSGTATHRKDLAEIARPLARIMARHPNVELHIVGALHLDNQNPYPLPDELRAFAARIQYYPTVSWEDWMAVQKRFDINLAPLETGNPFCDAKSEIKYTEAAMVKIPTIASRIGAYELAIRDGKTGFLAGNEEEWTAKLEALVTDRDLRRQMGEAAHADVLALYAPQVLGPQLVQTLTAIQTLRNQQSNQPSTTIPDQKSLILNWIFPEPIPGSGGYTDIVRMINLLVGFGHKVNAYVVPRQVLLEKSDLEVREFVRRHFTDIRGEIYKWSGGPLVESDAVILTHWSTAYLVDHVHNTSRIFYFVQDWEPFFAPMGTEYLKAEQTYKMGFSCITLGRWLTHRLREWYNADADYFDLAVDHSIYYPRPVEKTDRPRVCFYARPSTPRRLFPMGIEALELIYQRRPDVQIVLYGAENTELRREPIPFPYTNRGILNEQQLAELFSSSDVGIVLSSTNCSLVPPEMMACRCAVVDLNRETVTGVLEHEVNALLAEPTPKAIADAVLRLLEDEPLRQRLVETAYQQVQERSWEKSARRVEEILLQKLPATRRGRRRGLLINLPALSALPTDQQKRLNAIHANRRRLFTQAKALLRTWGKSLLLGVEQGVVLNEAPVRTLGELTGRKQIGQQFVARQNGLCRVDVLIGTYRRRNTRDVILHLKASPSDENDLATVRLNASLLTDQGYACFWFTPQRESEGKSYYISLESPESVPGDAITLWAYRDANVPNAPLQRNNHPIRGHLVYWLHYEDEQFGGVGGHPPLCNWGKRITLLDRIKKGIRVLTTQGPKGFQRELVNYWKWRTGKV
ncbi:MAG: glycosyltransferase [Anaerolineae bacterium]